MADHGLTESPVERAQRVLVEFERNPGSWEAADAVAQTLRALLATTREDNAPESIAHEVIARRYGDYETFAWSLHPSRMQGLSAQSILNMLKDAAAAGLDSREEF